MFLEIKGGQIVVGFRGFGIEGKAQAVFPHGLLDLAISCELAGAREVPGN